MNIVIHDLNLDLYTMKLNGVVLTRAEFLIVTKFFSSPNKLIKYDDIALLLWGTKEHYQRTSINKLINKVINKLNFNDINDIEKKYNLEVMRREGYIFIVR